MRIVKRMFCFIFAVVMLVVMSVPAFAVVNQVTNSLHISFNDFAGPVSGAYFRVYKVADVKAHNTYVYTDNFKDSGVELYGVSERKE